MSYPRFRGAEFEPDSEAALYANEHADTPLNDINPGNKTSGVIVFGPDPSL